MRGTPFEQWAARQNQRPPAEAAFRARRSPDSTTTRATGVPGVEAGQEKWPAELVYDRNRRRRGSPLQRARAREQHRDRTQDDLDKYLPAEATAAVAHAARASAARVDPCEELLLVTGVAVHRALRALAAAELPGGHHAAALR